MPNHPSINALCNIYKQSDHYFILILTISATAVDPSPCNASVVDTYSRRACAESLFYPSQRRLSDRLEETEGSHLAGEEEEQDRSLASVKYVPIPPLFSPSQGYLNFEVAIEKSDAGRG